MTGVQGERGGAKEFALLKTSKATPRQHQGKTTWLYYMARFWIIRHKTFDFASEDIQSYFDFFLVSMLTNISYKAWCGRGAWHHVRLWHLGRGAVVGAGA
jgi:hypothetical protein